MHSFALFDLEAEISVQECIFLDSWKTGKWQSSFGTVNFQLDPRRCRPSAMLLCRTRVTCDISPVQPAAVLLTRSHASLVSKNAARAEIPGGGGENSRCSSRETLVCICNLHTRSRQTIHTPGTHQRTHVM